MSDSIYEHYTKFYSALRKGKHDDALKEIVPPDVYAEHLADKYRRTAHEQTAAEPNQTLRDSLISKLKAGDVEATILLLGRVFNFGRYYQPLGMPLLTSGLGDLKAYLDRTNAQKKELIRAVLICDTFSVPDRVDWSLFLADLNPTSTTRVAAANYFLTRIEPWRLPFETDLRNFRDEMQAWHGTDS